MKTLRVVIPAILLMTAAGFAAGAQAAAPAAPALGQPGSLVEVYGLLDTGLRISTNDDAFGDSFFGFSQGFFNGSRFGIRGTEGLDGGLKAIYTLEGGVILPTGVLDQQGQIFGRQAWVGLSSDYGTLTFGRQYGTFSDAMGVGDVYGGGGGNIGNLSTASATASKNGSSNYSGTDAVNTFFESETGFRWDQSVKYAANFSGVTVGAMAMLGQPLVNYQYNTMFSGSIGYNSKDFPVVGAAGIQFENDTKSLHHLDMGIALKYALDPTDAVYAFYMHSQYDVGFQQINPNNSEFGNAAVALGRIDDIASVSANYYVLPSLNLIGAYFFDYAQNVLASGDNGMRNSFLLTGDYYFSKDFDMYLSGWVSLFSSALQNSTNGGDIAASNSNPVSSSLSVMIGARYRF